MSDLTFFSTTFYVTPDGRMIVENELRNMLNEGIADYLKVIFQHWICLKVLRKAMEILCINGHEYYLEPGRFRIRSTFASLRLLVCVWINIQ
jgi:hypothetical protein